MIIFLYGQDTYRSREEIKRIIEEYKKANQSWLDFVRIDANDNEADFFEQVCRSVDTISMFSQVKLIIIENTFSTNKEFQKDVLEFLKKRNLEKDKDTIIIFWDEEVNQKNNLFKILKTKTKCQEFKPLKGEQLKSWIKEYINEKKGKIEIKAVDKLVDYVGSDLWRMSNEINKLISFKKQDTRNRIQIEDIELLVKPEIDLNIFEMVDALGHKNKNKVLNLFRKYLEKGEDELYLLAMFIYQIRNLLRVKAGGKLDIHPFVIKKVGQQAINFSFEDLKKIYYQLLTIDFDIKTGKTDSKTALELFVTAL
jgi:DNA polymerase-3 subunit delta